MQFTRGSGLFENYLSKKRSQKADSLIADVFRSGSILDVGCGTYPYFLANTKFKNKYGIDPEAKIDNNDSDLKLNNIFIKKGTPLPFENKFFSVITSLGVLEHFDNETLLFICREAFRLLKPGGQLVLTAPNNFADNILKFLAFIRFISPQEIKDARYVRKNEELISMLIKSGFQKDNISMGFFELGMNRWFCAKKENFDEE